MMPRSVTMPDFNSRPSARGDAICVHILGRQDISIHAPPRGATRRAARDCGEADFNSRPSARGDSFRTPRILLQFHFNSRPSARGDPWPSADSQAVRGFQFTPLREGRPPRRKPCRRRRADFNSRPSARGDGRHHMRHTADAYFNSRPSARGDSAA